MPPSTTKKPRGFAALSPERLAEISARGGRSAHESGSAHRWTSEEAREAGRKGARSTHARRRKAKAEEAAQ